MTLQQLKDKATASELTLIEAVQAAVEENAFQTARHMVRDAAIAYIGMNRPSGFDTQNWCRGLGQAIENALPPKTDTP